MNGDRPARWLGAKAKEVILVEWGQAKDRSIPEDMGGSGYPDPAIIEWCDRINDLAGVCTVQSCAGHRFGDGSQSAGHLWLRLSREVSGRFDERALELAILEGIEQVARIYTPWGEEVTSITFAGNERNLLAQSMGTILSFLHQIAMEAHGDH